MERALDLHAERALAVGGATSSVFVEVENVTGRANAEEVVWSGDYATRGYLTGLPILALAGLTAWGLINATLVHLGWADLPLISLALGLTGACAIITTGTLLAEQRWLDWLRFCGANSIVIYLAFFLPMAISRSRTASHSTITRDMRLNISRKLSRQLGMRREALPSTP